MAPDRTQGGKHGRIAAEAFLEALSAHGVDYLFANPGTDFPPIVEAYCRARRSNAKVPAPLVIPHENLAVAMAHGAYAMTGRPQAVMVHVNVGTANAITNILNLGRDRVPVILAAGRTPIVEQEKFGSRNRPIHWGQEMFDQAAMLREAVKWDYELRAPEQAAGVVARAYEVAMTSPRGPVYLSLPREPLAAPLPDSFRPEKPRSIPSRPCADARAIAMLADWIALARNPLIITTSSGSEAMAALGRVAQRYAIPVCAHRQLVVCLPSSHAMHMGYDPKELLPEVDLVIEIESDVPYIPNLQGTPPSGCRIATIGEDPAYVRYPMRSFPTDLAITASAASALEALEAALEKAPVSQQRIEQRRREIVQHRSEREARLTKVSEPPQAHISLPYLSRVIADVMGENAVLFNEYSLLQDHCPREKPDTFYALSSAGGLGWGLGAALGAKVAAPDKLVVAVLGDGTYMFSNPMVAHWVADVHKAPVLTVILNNSLYGAVRSATLSMFNDGVAGEEDGRFMADLHPSPAYELALKAHDGHAERVERPADLPAALRRARDAVVNERRQALVNVVCRY
jgi:acetolactate synthase I/II/III large subunit